MAFQSVPNVYGVEIRVLCDGEKVENTLYFRRSGLANQNQLDTLTATVADWWFNNLRALAGVHVTMREVFGRDLENNPFLVSSNTFHSGVSGIASGNPEQNYVTKSIQFKSTLSGRSARGSNRVVGLTENQTTGNFINSNTLDLFIDAYDILNASVGLSECVHVIVSRRTNNQARPFGINYLVESYVAPNNLLGTMRTRTPTS